MVTSRPRSPTRERDTIVDLMEVFSNFEDRVSRHRNFGTYSLARTRSFRERPALLKPQSIVSDYDRLLSEQFRDLAEHLHLDIRNTPMELLDALPPPEKTGQEARMLGQHSFGRALTTCGQLRFLPIPTGSMFGNPHQFAAYLRRYARVGVAMQFSCALPCTDGKTWLSVRCSENESLRRLHVRTSESRAHTNTFYLLDFGPAE